MKRNNDKKKVHEERTRKKIVFSVTNELIPLVSVGCYLLKYHHLNFQLGPT